MNRNFSRKLLVYVGLLITLTSVAFPQAQDETGTVEGFVWSPYDPYVAAKIVVTSLTFASYEKMELTNERGYFSCMRVPVGEVEIRVYDGQDQLIGQGSGLLTAAGETVTVEIEPVP